jgi:putative transposase
MLRYRLAAYREQGLAGLIPEERSDKGQTHGISPRMERIIRGIRLSNRNATVKTVHRESCKRASETNEKAPSVWQVRTVIKKIPEPLLLLADGREREFRNKYRLTYRIRFEGVVWQIDQTPVDALAVDIRQRGYQTKSGDTRIYLTTVIECNSRRVLAARFGYEPANRFNVAAVLRDAILVGGRPDEIWTDHGEEFKSRHVADLLSEFKIYIEYTNRPELKGRIERVFRTFNEQLWREQPGYVGSNTTQRHPDKRVKLSIAQLEKRFWKYLNEEYHQQPHSELPEKEDAGDDGYVPIKMSPMEYWNEYCFAEHIDPRRLDVFLKDVRPHTVGKWGIKHHQRKYWHESLGEIIGEDVRVRAAPYYKGPDEIEVFHNGRWVCTAFAYDSPKGEKVTGHDVARAQGQQRRGYRGQITEGRRDLRKVDKQIADEERSQQPTQQSPQESSTSTPESTAAKDESAAPNQSLPPNQSDNPRPANRQGNQSKGSRKPNFLDRMGDD